MREGRFGNESKTCSSEGVAGSVGGGTGGRSFSTCTREGKDRGSGEDNGDEDAEEGGDGDGERHDRWDPSLEEAGSQLSMDVAVAGLDDNGARCEGPSTSIAAHSLGSWWASDDAIRVLPIAESLALREPEPVGGVDAPTQAGGEGESLAGASRGRDMSAARGWPRYEGEDVGEVEALLRGWPSCEMGGLLRGVKIGVRCRKSGVAPRRGRITSGRVVAVGAPICTEGANVIVTTGADMVLGREGGAPTRAAQ